MLISLTGGDVIIPEGMETIGPRAFTTSSAVYADTTVYAQWESNDFTIWRKVSIRYADGEIATWAKAPVTLLVESGAINGFEEKINLTGATTRAEMLQVLYNLLTKK